MGKNNKSGLFFLIERILGNANKNKSPKVGHEDREPRIDRAKPNKETSEIEAAGIIQNPLLESEFVFLPLTLRRSGIIEAVKICPGMIKSNIIPEIETSTIGS
tara:strand:- start:373 stop:681 length:309 start_codon:yes stop_codon:yes gene_type:complete